MKYDPNFDYDYLPDVDYAIEFATEAHSGQKRKYTGEDYIEHPMEVARIVRDVIDAEEGKNPLRLVAITAAILHDTVEDCDVTLDDLTEKFGSVVSEYVAHLTHVDPDFGNRAARKAEDARRLSLAPPMVKTIKLADVIHNSGSILEHDPKFAKVFMREMTVLVAALEGGHPELHATAMSIIEGYYNESD